MKKFDCSGTIHGCERVKLFGCGDCGSEYTEKEKNKQKSFCRLCCSEAKLEEMGEEYACHLIPD